MSLRQNKAFVEHFRFLFSLFHFSIRNDNFVLSKKHIEMLTKEYITELKYRGNEEISSLINAQRDVGSINYILESLGQLPNNFNPDFLYNLLNHNHAQVRLNAVKNIAKLNGKSDTNSLFTLYQKENDTSVRREIVSAIGRQRKCKNKPLLYSFLTDADPKIICQAIRGLLVFENDKEVEESKVAA